MATGDSTDLPSITPISQRAKNYLKGIKRTANLVNEFVESQTNKSSSHLVDKLSTNFKLRSKLKPSGSTSRGRPTQFLKIKITCLSSPRTHKVNNLDLARLQRLGLGCPDSELKIARRTPSSLPLSWNKDQLKTFITNSFPQLRNVPFEYALSEKSKLCKLPDDIITPAQIKAFMDRENKKGCLFIRPLLDLTASCIKELTERGHVQIATSSEEDILDQGLTERGHVQTATCSEDDILDQVHQTETLVERRTIIQEQDDAYVKSLETDQEKERRKKEIIEIAEEEDRKRGEMEAKLQQLRRERAQRLPREPDEGLKLKFKTSTSWTDTERVFRPESEIQVLTDFVGSMEGSTEHFQMFLPGRPPISSTFINGTLADVGIKTPTVIQVKWLEQREIPEPDLDIPGNERENQEPEILVNETPSTSRVQRRAAQQAHQLITNVCMSIQISDSESDNEVIIGDSNGPRAITDNDTLPLETEKSLKEVLFELSSQVDTNMKKNIVNVQRNNVLDGAIRAFKRSTFKAEAELSVKFSAENGIDMGGPSKEFMRLALREIKDLPIFDGQENEKFIVIDYKAMENGLYEMAGKIIAYILVHGGPLPNFLHPLLYQAIALGINNVETKVDHIMEIDLRGQLQQVERSTDMDSFLKATNEMDDLISLAGCHNLSWNYADKGKLLKSVSHFLVFGRTNQALLRFADGLKTLDVLKAIRGNPIVEKAFVFHEVPLTAETIEDLFEIKESEWSPSGSNVNRKEQQVHAFWRDLLLDLEESGRLEDLLRFATGFETIPPLGIDPRPELKFNNDEDEWIRKFPKANTCGNILYIPLVDKYDDFKTNVLLTITNVSTFTDI